MMSCDQGRLEHPGPQGKAITSDGLFDRSADEIRVPIPIVAPHRLARSVPMAIKTLAGTIEIGGVARRFLNAD
jgi:hypothetical protein